MVEENKDLFLYSTRGTSMFPFIRCNEYVLVKKVPIEIIQQGDTVVFESDGEHKVCHRVVKIEEKNGVLWFYNKGDKNKSCDGPVRKEKILGRVIAVRRKINIIELSTKGWQSLLYKLGCFFVGKAYCIRNVLAKSSFIKKLYRYTRKKLFFI